MQRWTRRRLTPLPPKSLGAWTLAFWAFIALWMLYAGLSDPPTLGGEERGHNVEGSLALGLLASTLELVVFMALLRPWSGRSQWGGVILAWGVFLPWTMISMLMSLHGGSVLMLHLLWLGVLLLSLSLFTLSAIAQRRPPR